MVTHQIYVPTQGKDPKKYRHIKAFTDVSGKQCHKLVISGFRNAGKVKEFLKAHSLATTSYGENYNGYGYADHTYMYLLTLRDAKILQEMIDGKKKKTRIVLTEEEKVNKWAARLAKLTGISLENALMVADDKLSAKRREIDELENRQDRRYSERRQKEIDKLERSNPLRRIKDERHAHAILRAYMRHNYSDYEYLLDEAREKAAMGEIDRGDVKAYARSHYSTVSSIEEVFFTNDDEEDEDEEKEDENEEPMRV